MMRFAVILNHLVCFGSLANLFYESGDVALSVLPFLGFLG